jgi:hypothetical protein
LILYANDRRWTVAFFRNGNFHRREPELSQCAHVSELSQVALGSTEEAEMINHTLHTALDASEINEAGLMDAIIYGPEDEKIGTVAHVHGKGAATQIIVDVGGFLGIGTKSVVLDANQLNFMRDEDGEVYAVTSWTKAQVKDFPEHHH